MKTSYLFLFLNVVIFTMSASHANEQPGNETKKPINVNITTGDLKLEVEGLEDTLNTLGDSVKTLTQRMKVISENPNITEEEARLIRELVTELNKTVQAATALSNSLPQKIKDSQAPIRYIGNQITSQIKSVIFFSILAFVIAIVIIIYFSYLYLFKPIQRVAEKMATISGSIEKTVDKVAEFEAMNNKKFARRLVKRRSLY